MNSVCKTHLKKKIDVQQYILRIKNSHKNTVQEKKNNKLQWWRTEVQAALKANLEQGTIGQQNQ